MNSSKRTIIVMTVFIWCVCEMECGIVTSTKVTRNSTGNCTEDVKGLSNINEGREKKEDMMSKILPMMVMPFITQTTFLPMMLMSMKFMLIQSMFLGKFAIILGFVTFLRNLIKNKKGGFYSHNVNVQSHHHGRDFGYYEETNR